MRGLSVTWRLTCLSISKRPVPATAFQRPAGTQLPDGLYGLSVPFNVSPLTALFIVGCTNVSLNLFVLLVLHYQASVIFVLIYFLVLVFLLVFQLFSILLFSFSIVLYFLVLDFVIFSF